jgi:hypothetical protein
VQIIEAQLAAADSGGGNNVDKSPPHDSKSTNCKKGILRSDD